MTEQDKKIEEKIVSLKVKYGSPFPEQTINNKALYEAIDYGIALGREEFDSKWKLWVESTMQACDCARRQGYNEGVKELSEEPNIHE